MSRESGGAMRSAEEWWADLTKVPLLAGWHSDHYVELFRRIQADARRATWAEAIEAVLSAIEGHRGFLDRYTVTELLRALTPPEGGGGKESEDHE